MNVASVVMGAAGLLASVISGALSVRYVHGGLTRSLLVDIRSAASSLLGGKELESFFAEYRDLVSALGKLALTQCLLVLIFTLPMVAIFQLTLRCFPSLAAVTPPASGVWITANELIFMIAFMAGTFGTYIRRRM